MKKLISLILAILMIFSCAGSVMALDVDKIVPTTWKFGDRYPMIYIDGIVSKGIYYKEDTQMENPLFFPINTQMILDNLGKYKDILARAVLEEDINLLANFITVLADDCYGDIALKEDGYTMSDKVWVPETKLDPYGDAAKEGKYIFQYECRHDPVDIASELKEYIECVKKHTGKDKVEIIAPSYGSSIALAYINEYPDFADDIDSLVISVPVVNGVNFAGELFSGKVNIDANALKNFLGGMVADEAVMALVATLVKTGALDFLLESLINPAVNEVLMDAIRNIILNIFGTMPSMWSFVDDRYFDDAITNIYGEEGSELRVKYAGLIERITYYHENILVRADELVNLAVKNKVKTSIVAKYGIDPIPLSKEGNFMGDGFVRLEVASFGATSSMHQQKLPADYKQANCPEHNHMSPDWCIDASTCLLPENTWFIKNLDHSTKNDGYYDLLYSIAYNDLDITKSEKFPQFLVVSEEDNALLVPLKGNGSEEAETEEKETTWLEDFFTFLKGIFPRLIEIIKGWFSK